MTVVENAYVVIEGAEARIRALVSRPKGAARRPVIVAWSDIFQLTPPHVRMVQRIAGHGFVVVAPELYSRLEGSGRVFDFERDRQAAIDATTRMEPAWIDAERRVVLDYAKSRGDVQPSKLGVCGWCFGGHLAFRAALEPDVKAAACFYATGIHDGNLGAARGTADSLQRVSELRGSLLLVWGASDPHIPRAARAQIHRALEDAAVRYEARTYPAEHAFMRDEGPRWDPESADRAFAEMIELFRRA